MKTYVICIVDSHDKTLFHLSKGIDGKPYFEKDNKGNILFFASVNAAKEYHNSILSKEDPIREVTKSIIKYYSAKVKICEISLSFIDDDLNSDFICRKTNSYKTYKVAIDDKYGKQYFLTIPDNGLNHNNRKVKTFNGVSEIIKYCNFHDLVHNIPKEFNPKTLRIVETEYKI